MDSAGNTVSYCCVWKTDRLLYTYNNGGRDEIHKLAASCLQKTPPHHRWYFETAGTYTFGFLMDADGHVYFTIVRHSLGNSRLLRFLQTLRDEFRRTAADQLFPVVLGLIASLEQWPAPDNPNNTVDNVPLLGNKKTKEDQVVMMIEMEETERRSDRGRVRSDQGASSSSSSSAPENASTRILSKSSCSQKNKWCRQVRIVLAVDAAVCFLLFIIWLFICHGTQCIR